jgi:hypothetical protein
MKMPQARSNRPGSPGEQALPWYRYPWPWVAIAIPAVAVVGGLFTLYLAVSNPDPLVVDEGEYRELRTELRAEMVVPADEGPGRPAGDVARDEGDGEH